MYYLTYIHIDEEVAYQIYDSNKQPIYSENVISDWDNEYDVIATGIEIAKSRGYYPVAIVDSADDINNAISQAMSELGKRSWQARKDKQDMSELAKKRWKKNRK